MMGEHLIVTAMAGFMGHQTRHLTDRIEADAWNSITRYAIGSTLVYPLFERLFLTLLMRLFPQYRLIRERVADVLRASYFLSLLFFGIGVAVAYLFQDWIEEHGN